MARIQAELLQGFERLGRVVDGGFPERLQFGKHFFADMARIAPAVAKLVQHTAKALPVVVQRHPVGLGPSLEFFDQRQALGAVLGRLGLHFLEPGFHHLVGFVAGFVKAFPQRMVGHAALVGQLPLLTQCTQLVLHLAAPHGLALGALEQAFGIGHQFFAQLIGAPALPAFEFAGCYQRRMGLRFKLIVNQTAVVLERLAQSVGRTGAGLAMALGHFMLQLGQHLSHKSCGLGTNLGVHFGLGGRYHGL